MDSDQEYERFDVDNDFEGGEFVDGEFYFQNKRRKRAQSKEDQLYGVFAENSDEEREERRFGMAAGGGKRPNYSKPVGFVGGGVVQHGPQDDKDAEAADEEEGAARGGLGSGAAAGGLGFRPAAAAAPPAPSVRPAAHDEEEEEEELIPTAFGRRIKQAADQRRQQGEAAARSERQQQQQQQQQRGGLGRPGLGGAGAPAPSTGTFEAHTKGIGAKLLSKMGWQAGKGLGKEGTGIAKPLEATLRPKGMGMGFGDRREPKMAPPAPKPAAAADAPAAKGGSAADVRREAALWRSKHEGARVKRTFRTADEVLAEAEEKGASAPAQTIIDMRGPQARVVTNLEHLNVQDEAEGGGGGGGGGPVPMPELQHNVRLLVDLAEADIQRVDARLRHHRDTQTILRREAQRLEAEAAAAEAAAGRLAGVLAAVAAARQGAASSPESARAAFAELRAQLAEDYVMYGLPAVALAAALPALAAALAGWAPLAAPAAPAAAFAAWRPLLQGGASRHADPSSPLSPGGAADPYTRLVADLLLPRLRTALANEWDPREPEPLEALLECWQPLLPAEVVEHVMTHLVLPRLRAAAGEWDPLRDPLPPHIWLHPWLPHLGAQMSELWPPLRFKFASALQQWHPADASAHGILAPWRRVFGAREWEALMQRAVLPKLAAALAELVVNPAAQDLEPFAWAMAWADLLPASQLAALLDAHFFPKWHAVLRHWLAHAPDYDEVTRWYLGWKALMPDALLDHERLRAQMGAALNAMNTAVAGQPLPATWTPAPPAGAAADGGAAGEPRHPSLEEAYGAPHAAPEPAHAFDAEALTLRELVARYAEDAGVAFAPKAGRVHEGLQVFHFGRVSCVVDTAHGLVRAALGGDRGWAACSMEEVLREHERREREAAARGRR